MEHRKMTVTADGLVPANHAERTRSACYSKEDRDPPAEQIALARAHLERFWEPAKTAYRGSYGLKHIAEGREYICNGALIQAALDLGLRVEPTGGGINARVYVKMRRETKREFLSRP